MIKLRFVMIFILLQILLFANPLDECQSIAQGLLNHLSQNKSILKIEEIEENKSLVGCLASYQDGGYALISNSKSANPIKMYALNGNFDALPPTMIAILRKTLFDDSTNQTAQINLKREYLLNLKTKNLKKLYAPLPSSLPLNSSWNQDGLYQKYMPKINNQNTLVGCANVALGQIMRHHKHPTKGTGFVTTKWNNQLLKAITNRYYNWNNMPNNLDAQTPDNQTDEVAMLLFDLAIANKTDFGVDGSGASLNIETLYKNFGYSKDVKYIEAIDKNIFFSTIKTEIQANRPMYLSLPGINNTVGHAVVVDSYVDDAALQSIHLNFGWSGANDNYYDINSVSLVVENLDLTSKAMRLHYNIKPCSSEANDCYVNLESIDTQSNLNINGNLNSQDDEDIFDVYLSGNTQFTASSDYYSTPDFFLNLYDYNNSLILSSKDKIATTSAGLLPATKYKLAISKKNATTNSFYSKGQTNNYNVTISTTTLSSNDKTVIDEAIAKAPTIFDNLKPISLKKEDTYKITINAANEINSTDIINIIGDPNIISTTFVNNILTISALNSGITNLKIKAFANSKESFKTIPITVLDNTVAIGKNIILQDTFLANDTAKKFNFKAVLDGQCSIVGDRGYSNTAFYISVTNQTTPTSQSINQTFTKNIYTISASLEDGNKYFSIFDKPTFTISISCPNADVSTTSLANIFNYSNLILDSNSSISINSGWNLIALPSNDKISISKLLHDYNDIYIIWKYVNGEWFANGNNATIAQKIKENNIRNIDYISSNEGFWIYANKPFGLFSDGTIKQLDLSTLHSSWNLVGTNIQTTPSDIKAINSNIQTIWKYKNGIWQTDYSGVLPTGVTKLENIDNGEGFWILN